MVLTNHTCLCVLKALFCDLTYYQAKNNFFFVEKNKI